MKKILLFILIFFPILKIFSINIVVENYNTKVTIKDNILNYHSGLSSPDGYIGFEEYYITHEFVGYMHYISFYYNGLFMETITHGFKKYLILYSDEYLIFFNKENIAEYILKNHNAEAYDFTYKIYSTSELTEGNFTYKAENLTRINNLFPWVEGVNGSGIGEKIIAYQKKSIIFAIVISNGFVDYNRPYLYENNNRVKKIRISDGSLENIFDVEIKDTPNPQYIYIMDNLVLKGKGVLSIEILEVYKGFKWDDTCINFIRYWDE